MDYHTSGNLQNAIGSFGRLVYWEDDRANITRPLLKTWVTLLEDIPQFIFSDAEGFLGSSSMIQCEIMQQELLGALPTDEDHVLALGTCSQML